MTHQRRCRIIAGTLQLFISIGALAGGAGLIFNPTGANLGMPLDLLSNSQFTDYLVPGIILLSLIGIGHCIGGLLSLRGVRISGSLTIILGILLLFWITAQVSWIGLTHWLQPLYFGLGLLEIVFGAKLRSGLS